MAREEHFPQTVQQISENLQHAVGRTWFGQAVANALAGSDSSAYHQLEWRSQGINTQIHQTVVAPGDPAAGKLARNWNHAAVLALSEEDLKELTQPQKSSSQEAVAFLAHNKWHVGTLPNAQDKLFGRLLNDGSLGVAMRLGHQSLTATCGLWVPKDRFFLGARNVELKDAKIHISNLPLRYPYVKLV